MAVLLLLGLTAKSMLVTVPCVLLLLDYWPLNRLNGIDEANRKRQTVRLAVEKIPLFGVVLLSAVLTYFAQDKGEMVKGLESLPLGARAANAALSYVTYLQQMLWPSKLAVFYPHPAVVNAEGVIPAEFYFRAVAAVVVLVAITTAVIVWGRAHRYLIVGWFWYLGTLVPVIGLVQVGWQGHADRYTYVPLIGIFILLCWGVPDLLRRVPGRRYWLDAVSLATIAGCLMVTRTQVETWRDGISLYSHAVAVTTNNWRADILLAMALRDDGRYREAITRCEHALQFLPDDADVLEIMATSYYRLGLELDGQGSTAEAADAFAQAIQARPDDAAPHNELGLLYFRTARYAEAVTEFRAAIDRDPRNLEARANLGAALCQSGRTEEGLDELRRCVAEDARFLPARINLGLSLAQIGRHQEAGEQFEAALTIDPHNATAREMLLRSESAAPAPFLDTP